MAEPLINFSLRWLSIFYFPSFLVDFPLPMPTLNIGHGTHDDSRSGIDYMSSVNFLMLHSLSLIFSLLCIRRDDLATQFWFFFFLHCNHRIGYLGILNYGNRVDIRTHWIYSFIG